MSIKVAEAIGDRDGRTGDSSGNEILLRTFKQRTYEFTECLRCTDRSMADKAVQYATRIAACSKFGYSRSERWEGPKHIEAVGADRLEEAAPGDFDCSSFCIECYRLAGAPLKMTGYTGSIRKLLLATGLFKDVKPIVIESLQAGDILNAPGIHALMVVSGASEPRPAPEPEPIPTPGPAEDVFVLVKGDNVRVRSGPSKDYKTILIAHKGNRFTYLGADPETGWYEIELGMNVTGWITNKTKYTVLVKE